MSSKKRFGSKLISLILFTVLLTGCGAATENKPAETTTAQEQAPKDAALDVSIGSESAAEATTEAEAKEIEEAPAAEPEVPELFSQMPNPFVFSSGAGGWSTDIEIKEDGSFTGEYHDSDMGSTGEGYPYGTVYLCNFTGKFSNPKPTDQENVYSMKLLELKIDDESKVGTEEILDETKYIYTTPYGFENADEFMIYTPGTPVSLMSEECMSWVDLSTDIFKEVPESYYIIFNVGGEEAFCAVGEDTIWHHTCYCRNGDAYGYFSPAYYSGSYLSFFPNDDSAATLSLSVPWDGKNTDVMECGKAWSDDGSVFKVKVEQVKDSGPKAKFNIIVESVTDPTFDFSLWGGTEPGKFTGEFIEEDE